MSHAVYLGPTSDNLAALPAVLTHRRQFVLWQGRRREGHEGKLDKIPLNPTDLSPASTTDARTWGSFAVCVAALPTALEDWQHRDPKGFCGGGLGFVFTPQDPYTGIDLDDCVDATTGGIAPWAQHYVEMFHSYTEITPSTTGLHILVEGTLPAGRRRKDSVEMYDTGRFFTLTGWHLDDTPRTIEARQEVLAATWTALFHEQSRTPDAVFALAPPPPHTPAMTDQEVLARAFQASNGPKFGAVYSGDITAYGGDDSAADFALCELLRFWTQDPGQLDRLFRGSALMRPKWDEKRGTTTYGAMTIANALAAPSTQYTPPMPPPWGAGAGSANGVSHGTGAYAHQAQPERGTFVLGPGMSGRDLMRMERIPPRFLVDKLVPDGLTVLAAPAKSYKSYFALSLALATIGECLWCDAFPVNETGNVVFFGLEAPYTQLRNRLHQLRPQFVPENLRHEIHFFSGMTALPSFRHGLQQVLEHVIEQYHPRLIVIDPLSYLYRLGRQDDLASATLDLLWPLAEMAANARVALFAAEHMRKRSKEDVSVVDQLAGSHIKAAIVHGLLMLQRQGDDLIIETNMRDAAQQELTLGLDFDDEDHSVQWGYKGSSAMLAATRLDDLKGKVLDYLKQNKYPHRMSEIIETLELPNTDRVKGNVRKILNLGHKEGLLEVSRRGEYFWIGD